MIIERILNSRHAILISLSNKLLPEIFQIWALSVRNCIWDYWAFYACGLVSGIAVGFKEYVIGVISDDCAMLMANEVSTAMYYRLPVFWLVMNDSS